MEGPAATSGLVAAGACALVEGRDVTTDTGDITMLVGGVESDGRGGEGGVAGNADGLCVEDDVLESGEVGAGDTELGTILTAGTGTGAGNGTGGGVTGFVS